ncbi:MAG TPA: carboxypeptidase regulatory-like domain-containing protein, partial [Anaerolineae bacterium]|nr:carboxypeptidase regulatory-like domain-containing protein [Anaerolineae bacterium]
DEALEPWLRHITATQAVYAGEIGHTYRFAVRARDRAGNEAAVPLVAQASTETRETPLLSGVVLGPGRELVSGATVVIEGENTRRVVGTQADGTWPATPLPAGHYTVQAYASGYGVWPAPRSVELPAEPNAPGLISEAMLLQTLPPPDNAIAGGDFEDLTVWQHWDWAGQVDRYFRAFDGRFAARLGAGQGEPTSCANGQTGQRWSIRQSLTIPAVEPSSLSFVYRTLTAPVEHDVAPFAVTLITENGEHLLTPSAGPLQSNDWVQSFDWTVVTFDLSAWPGQAAEVQFEVTRCTDEAFAVLLDRVSVGARPGDR